MGVIEIFTYSFDGKRFVELVDLMWTLSKKFNRFFSSQRKIPRFLLRVMTFLSYFYGKVLID